MWYQQTIVNHDSSKSPKKVVKKQKAIHKSVSEKKVSPEYNNGHDKFKDDIIKDILNQIDYQAANSRGIVDVSTKDMAEDLKCLSTRTLVAWYEAYLHIRGELMFAGYELNGLKVMDRPADEVNKLLEKDPDFDLQKYIF